MTTTLKSITRCEVPGLDKSFQDLFLVAMFFLKLASMLHLMKRFAKTLYLFPSSLPSQICKNVELGLRNMRRANRNGTSHV